MKFLIKIWVILVALILGFATSCGDDELSFSLTAVNGLIEPADQKTIVLKPTPSTFFEWEACDPEKSGTVIYYLVIDKENGDFSNPLFKTLSENNGMRNFVQVTHAQLDHIANMTGTVRGGSCTLKWTVLSVKGTEILKAGKENKLTVTRWGEYAYVELPRKLYMTGAGADLKELCDYLNLFLSLPWEKRPIETNPEDHVIPPQYVVQETVDGYLKMTQLEENVSVFEGIAYFKKGEPLHFVDSIGGPSRTFYLQDGKIVEHEATLCDTTGAFKITVDFNNRSYSYSPVLQVFLHNTGPNQFYEMQPQGLGVWGFSSQRFNNSGDDRYKFRMRFPEIGDIKGRETEWKTTFQNNSAPGNNPRADYYHMRQYPEVGQWNGWPYPPPSTQSGDQWFWKRPNNNWWTTSTTVTFTLSFDGGIHVHTLTVQ